MSEYLLHVLGQIICVFETICFSCNTNRHGELFCDGAIFQELHRLPFGYIQSISIADSHNIYGKRVRPHLCQSERNHLCRSTTNWCIATITSLMLRRKIVFFCFFDRIKCGKMRPEQGFSIFVWDFGRCKFVYETINLKSDSIQTQSVSRCRFIKITLNFRTVEWMVYIVRSDRCASIMSDDRQQRVCLPTKHSFGYNKSPANGHEWQCLSTWSIVSICNNE